MKRIWIQRIGAAVLCAVLLAGCMPGGPAADSTASADPLTGQEQQYPGQRPAAVVIDNAPGSTTQWGIGSASVVLEAAARADTAPSLCLVYPSVSAMPTVGPVTLGQDLFWRLLSGQQVLPIQRGCDLYTRNFLDYWNLRAWTRWKQAATPSPPAIPTGPARCGAPTVNLWPRCWAA